MNPGVTNRLPASITVVAVAVGESPDRGNPSAADPDVAARPRGYLNRRARDRCE